MTATMAVALSGCELVDALSPKQPPAETPATRLLVSQGCRTTPEYAGCAVWSGDANHLFVVTYNVPSGAVVDSLLVIDVSPTVGRTFQRSIGITSSLFALAAARDGSVLYFTRKTQGAPSFDVGRLVIATGATTRLATTDYPDMSATADGTTIAYHALGSSPAADTVVLLTAATGARKSITVGRLARIGSFSPDDRDLILAQRDLRDTIQVWHGGTGMREYGSSSIPSVPVALGWTADGITGLLLQADGTVAQVNARTGALKVLTGFPAKSRKALGWSPAVSRVYAAFDDGNCYISQQCYVRHYNILGSTLAGSIGTVGAVNFGTFLTPFPAFVPSPDGRWLFHEADTGFLYLMPLSTAF